MAERTDARRRAEVSYKRRAYDVKTIQFPKGALEQLKPLAEAAGISLTRYIVEAVEARSGLKLTLDGEFPAPKKKTEQG